MSAERKFQIVQERLLGELPQLLQAKWRLLVAKRDRLERQQKNFEAEMKKFFRQLDEKIEVDDSSKAFRGLRLDDDGSIYEIFCECPACQADLHGVSVASIVEEMIRQNLIHPQSISTVRQRAHEIDSSKVTADRKHLLYN